MKKATIYIETTLKGPTVKEGAYAAVLEYIKKDGTPGKVELVGVEEKTTKHRSTLLAVVASLGRFREACEIEIVAGDLFVIGAIEQKRAYEWKRQEWINSKKEDVAHKNLWQEYLEVAEKHEIHAVYKKTNPYSKIMLDMMWEKMKETQ